MCVCARVLVCMCVCVCGCTQVLCVHVLSMCVCVCVCAHVCNVQVVVTDSHWLPPRSGFAILSYIRLASDPHHCASMASRSRCW